MMIIRSCDTEDRDTKEFAKIVQIYPIDQKNTIKIIMTRKSIPAKVNIVYDVLVNKILHFEQDETLFDSEQSAYKL